MLLSCILLQIQEINKCRQLISQIPNSGAILHDLLSKEIITQVIFDTNFSLLVILTMKYFIFIQHNLFSGRKIKGTVAFKKYIGNRESYSENCRSFKGVSICAHSSMCIYVPVCVCR